MSKDDFYVPTDIDALRMENELLAFEVRFLKAQAAEAERLKSRLEEVERSRPDLVLLRHLKGSPLVRFLEYTPGFRALERRYLNTDA